MRMQAEFHEIERNWWFTLPGTPHKCTARADVRAKDNIISIFDFWTHGPLQGKGYARQLLTQIRAKFQRVIIKAIGTETKEGTQKAESFWDHMFEIGLVDELHFLRKKDPIIRETPWRKTNSRGATGTKSRGATSRKPATTTPTLFGRSTKKNKASKSS